MGHTILLLMMLLLLPASAGVQKQKAVSAHFTSKQILPLGLQRNIVKDGGFCTYYYDRSKHIHPLLFQCWASVEDGGPRLNQHWVNAPCLLG